MSPHKVFYRNTQHISTKNTNNYCDYYGTDTSGEFSDYLYA